MKLFLLVSALLTSIAAYADADPLDALTKGQPITVVDLVQRIVGCNHFLGEEPYDEERRKQIQDAVEKMGCSKLPADEARIRRKFRNNKSAINSINVAKDFVY